MQIFNTFTFGDIVYLKTDPDQLPRMVYGVVVYKEALLYKLACGVNTSEHYDYEMSMEKNVVLTTSN